MNIGIALSGAALFLAILALDWAKIPIVVYETSIDSVTVSVVLATFSIMLLSQLYKETGVINTLSESISKLLNNPKAVLVILPAIIGLLPVAGGALMSAPLVEREAEKLKMKPEEKAYANMWFRHVIFPVYPLTPIIIIAALLTGVSLSQIILRNIPVVLVMVITGYIAAFRNTARQECRESKAEAARNGDRRRFSVSFSPILVIIIISMALELTGLKKSLSGFDLVLAIVIGLMMMILISRPSFEVFKRPFKSLGIYGIMLAAYGAFLLRNVMTEVGISTVFSSLAANGNIDLMLFLAVVPAILGMLTASTQGGVAVSVSIFSGVLTLPFAPEVAALIYISAFLGYIITPTHLCFTFTADYFKCSLGRVYKYVIPSFLATYATTLLVYYLL